MKRETVTIDMGAMCRCGKRRGLHRFGDEACPDPAWKPCSGRRQWDEGSQFFQAREGEGALEKLARAVLDERADMSGFTERELSLGAQRDWETPS